MTTNESLAALIACHDPQRCAQLTAWLDMAGISWVLMKSQESLPSPTDIAVVIRDQPWEETGNIASLELQRAIDERSVGLVAIGWPGPAEVVLPAEVSPREFINSVRLVRERVRLWRLVQTLLHRQETLSEQAMRDVITGLPNRRAWEAQLAARVAALRSAGRDGCLAILDLDHFKQVNDQHGHAAGDRVLQAVGKSLQSRVRQGDLVARLGGDEFGLLLDGLTSESAPAVLERIRRDLVREAFADELSTMTASLGYTVIHGTSDAPPDDLFHAADQALRRAKAAGRNRSLPAEA